MAKLEVIISEQLIDKPGAPPAGFYFKMRRVHAASDRKLLVQMTEAVAVVVRKALENTIAQLTGQPCEITYEEDLPGDEPKVH